MDYLNYILGLYHDELQEKSRDPAWQAMHLNTVTTKLSWKIRNEREKLMGEIVNKKTGHYRAKL